MGFSANALVLASYLFNPCYIGGWSSASHWGLTDQLFNTYWIFTKKLVPKREVQKGSHSYLLIHASKIDLIGVTHEWFGSEKILISDPHQTVIDFLNNPDIFSTQSMVDIVNGYCHSEHQSLPKLIQYVSLMGNRSIFKRLGFILEYLKIDRPEIIEDCLKLISKGPSQLSSKASCVLYLKKWHLNVPTHMVIK